MGTPAKGLNVSSVLINKSLYTTRGLCSLPDYTVDNALVDVNVSVGRNARTFPSSYYRAAGIERLRTAAESTDEPGRSCVR